MAAATSPDPRVQPTGNLSRPGSAAARAIVTLPKPPGLAAALRNRLMRLLAPAIVLGVWQCISLYVLDDTTRA